MGFDAQSIDDWLEMLASQNPRNVVEIDAFINGCMRMRGTATGIDQQALLLETRNIRRMTADNRLKLKQWQQEVSQKLEVLLGAVLRSTANATVF